MKCQNFRNTKQTSACQGLSTEGKAGRKSTLTCVIMLLYCIRSLSFIPIFLWLIYLSIHSTILLFPGTILEKQVEQEADWEKCVDLAQTLTQNLLKRQVFNPIIFQEILLYPFTLCKMLVPCMTPYHSS